MKWKVGQTVMVQSRTWANINKPGGCAKIVKIHTSGDDGNDNDNDNVVGDDGQCSYVEGLDVKYVVGGGRENNLDPAIVAPYEILERGRRSRRGRDFLMQDAATEKENRTAAVAMTTTTTNQKQGRRRGRDSGPKEGIALCKKGKKEIKNNANANELRSGATCSTPEPPKRKGTKKLPKKVTPIPKMVVVHTGKDADDVSPMWMDASSFGSVLSTTTHNQSKNKHNRNVNVNSNTTTNHHHHHPATLNKKKTSVARGLNFGIRPTTNNTPDDKSSTEKAAASSKNQGVLPPPLSTATTALLPPKRSSSLDKKNRKHDTAGLTFSLKKNHRKLPKASGEDVEAINSKRKQPAMAAKVSASRKRKQQGTDHATAAMATTQRYHLHSKPKAKIPLPQQASFSRATSAYQNNSTNTSTTTTNHNGRNPATSTTKQSSAAAKKQQHRKPLLDVYRCEVEKARQFMDEMVSGPRNSSERDNTLASFTTTSHQHLHRQPTANTADQRVRAERSTSPKSRYEEFLSHLYKVWIKVDGEEEISEDRFKAVFHEVTGKSFSAPELDAHLSSLCEEGKEVMKSEGMLYRIH